jgi:glutamyl-Q tRNA(Asp) synthetase
VTSIVRGRDLLESTPLHLELQRRLGLPEPGYWHIPIVATATGEKLSKGSGARPVDLMSPPAAAAQTLELLGIEPAAELRGAPPRELWQWAARYWRVESLADRTQTRAPPD